MLYTSMSRRTAVGLISAGVASACCGQDSSSSSAAFTSVRPRFHITRGTEWINDPQRAIWLNNAWNLWVLWNGDFPTGRGTAWRHFTSTDLVSWTDQGVSIPKNTTPYGDVWTGSAVVDVNNTAGFGSAAVIALMTMPCRNAPAPGQSTGLWYSTDHGKTFQFDSIVLPNPGNIRVFRDPNVFWHAPTHRWVMSLAEPNKIRVYTSPDLKHWTPASSLERSDIGTMECPNMFPLHLYDANGKVIADKWVLLCGANGHSMGRTINTYYWVGTFDGTTFTPDTPNGQWLDFGSDFYACAVFGPRESTDALSSAIAVGWMNNWAYANLASKMNYFGQLSVVRTLKLQVVNGSSVLLNPPVAGINSVFTSQTTGSEQMIKDGKGYTFPKWGQTAASRIDFTLKQKNGAWPETISLSMRGGSGYFTQLTFQFAKNNIFLKRDTSGPQPTTDSNWTNNSNAPFAFTGAPLNVSVLLDVHSIEVFINGGQVSISSLITAPEDATALSMAAVGGTAQVSGFTIRSIA
jgi:levanase